MIRPFLANKMKPVVSYTITNPRTYYSTEAYVANFRSYWCISSLARYPSGFLSSWLCQSKQPDIIPERRYLSTSSRSRRGGASKRRKKSTQSTTNNGSRARIVRQQWSDEGRPFFQRTTTISTSFGERYRENFKTTNTSSSSSSATSSSMDLNKLKSIGKTMGFVTGGLMILYYSVTPMMYIGLSYLAYRSLSNVWKRIQMSRAGSSVSSYNNYGTRQEENPSAMGTMFKTAALSIASKILPRLLSHLEIRALHNAAAYEASTDIVEKNIRVCNKLSGGMPIAMGIPSVAKQDESTGFWEMDSECMGQLGKGTVQIVYEFDENGYKAALKTGDEYIHSKPHLSGHAIQEGQLKDLIAKDHLSLQSLRVVFQDGSDVLILERELGIGIPREARHGHRSDPNDKIYSSSSSSFQDDNIKEAEFEETIEDKR